MTTATEYYQAARVVERAREIISDPDHWTRNKEATNSVGMLVPARSDGAVKFCARGAMRRASGEQRVSVFVLDLALSTSDEVARYVGVVSHVRLNDQYGRAQTVALLDATATVLNQLAVQAATSVEAPELLEVS